MGSGGEKWDTGDRYTATRMNQKTLKIATAAAILAEQLYSGQFVFPSSTSSPLTTDVPAIRNSANSGWLEFVMTTLSQTITGAKTFNALILGANMNANNFSLDSVSSINGRSDSDLYLITGGNTRQIEVFTKDSGGSNVSRMKYGANAIQGSAGITCNEPISFGHADAGLVNPVMKMLNRIVYVIDSLGKVSISGDTGFSSSEGRPGISITSDTTSGDFASASTQLLVRRDRKYEATFWIIDIATTSVEHEIGFTDASGGSMSVGTDLHAVFVLDVSASGVWRCRNGNGTNQTETVTAVTAADDDILAIVNNETDIRFFINGVLVATHTTNLPGSSTELGYRQLVRNESGSARSFAAMAVIWSDRI